MLETQGRIAFEEEHEIFRDTVRKFFAEQVTPNNAAWEEAGIVPRAFWEQCGEMGLLCPNVSEEWGGLGLDFRYNAIINEELGYTGATAGIALQSDITVGYIEGYGSEAQKRALLPKMISGEIVTAIAMTEPNTGSDLQGIRTSAVRDGEEFVINGAKTYISSGQTADLVIVVARTRPEGGSKGLSLILVEADRAGFSRGRNLDKIGHKQADTSELAFEDVRVPVSNLLGPENGAFGCLMSQLPQERLSIAVAAQAAAQRAFDEAVSYTRERKAFGQSVFDFQATRFALAEMKTELQAGWAHLDWCLLRHVEGKLTTAEASAGPSSTTPRSRTGSAIARCSCMAGRAT